MDVGVGFIDGDYRGPVSVIFFNFPDRFIHTENSNRLCEIFFQRVASHLKLAEVEKFTNMTRRGEGSFGLTGLRDVQQNICEQILSRGCP